MMMEARRTTVLVALDVAKEVGTAEVAGAVRAVGPEVVGVVMRIGRRRRRDASSVAAHIGRNRVLNFQEQRQQLAASPR